MAQESHRSYAFCLQSHLPESTPGECVPQSSKRHRVQALYNIRNCALGPTRPQAISDLRSVWYIIQRPYKTTTTTGRSLYYTLCLRSSERRLTGNSSGDIYHKKHAHSDGTGLRFFGPFFKPWAPFMDDILHCLFP